MPQAPDANPPAVNTTAPSAHRASPDYMKQMINAATMGDAEAGQAAEIARNEKIDAQGLDVPKISYDDLYVSAKIATAEAGNVPGAAGDEVIQRIIEVVINRVASPEFPDTVREVVYQPGQYYVNHPAYAYFERTQPSERVLKIALRVLRGERLMTPAVVFHSDAPFSSGAAHSVYMGHGWGTMYFSYSYSRGLYT